MSMLSARDLSLFLARHPSETDKDWAYLVGLVAKERDDALAEVGRLTRELDAARTLAAAEYADAERLRAGPS